jgi:uncharacterized protein involved in exopolysaccharide biosynthesis
LIVETGERATRAIERLARQIDDRFCNLERKVMATMEQLQASLDAVGDQLTKASGEIQAEIKTLQDELAAGGLTTPGVDASVARLQGLAQALDDLNADAPPPPPAPAPPAA